MPKNYLVYVGGGVEIPKDEESAASFRNDGAIDDRGNIGIVPWAEEFFYLNIGETSWQQRW